MTFGNTLHRMRMQRGLSQAEIARRTGLNHSYISRLESGTRYPTRPAVMGITDALNATPAERDELLLQAGFAPVDINNYLARLAPELGELAELLDRVDGIERRQLVRKMRDLVESVRERLEAA